LDLLQVFVEKVGDGAKSFDAVGALGYAVAFVDVRSDFKRTVTLPEKPTENDTRKAGSG
jgi:hypothetical protein